ncbi:hypothetical protein V1292_002217 [Bradyrhizobium sp. AZCC 1719]
MSEGGSVPTIKQRDQGWMVGTSLALLCPLYNRDVCELLTLPWRGRVGSHERSEMRNGVG